MVLKAFRFISITRIIFSKRKVQAQPPRLGLFFLYICLMNSLAIVIAPVVHSVVFEWNEANHIHSFPHWEDISDAERKHFVDLVTFAINNPNASELMLYNNFRTTESTWEELSEVDKKTWMLYHSTIQVLIAEV